MKKTVYLLFALFFLASCGGNSNAESSENRELTKEEESALADSLTTLIDSDIEEVKQATDKNLQEIDSLLENF